MCACVVRVRFELAEKGLVELEFDDCGQRRGRPVVDGKRLCGSEARPCCDNAAGPGSQRVDFIKNKK